MVTNDPKNVDKCGQLVTDHKREEPPYEETPELKILNALKVTHIPRDDLNLALYMRENMEAK